MAIQRWKERRKQIKSLIQEEILNESKQVGILYHFTTVGNLEEILESMTLESKNSLSRDNIGGVSVTRYYKLDNSEIGDSPVRIVLNGDKLSQNYKIRPIVDPTDINKFGKHSFYYEAEERILSPRVNIQNSIIQIDLQYYTIEYKDFLERQEFEKRYPNIKFNLVRNYIPYKNIKEV